jgi:hypothetical protein
MKIRRHKTLSKEKQALLEKAIDKMMPAEDPFDSIFFVLLSFSFFSFPFLGVMYLLLHHIPHYVKPFLLFLQNSFCE